MEEIKTKSIIDAKIDELLNTASVLEKFRGWIEPQDYFSVANSTITLWPDSEDASRRHVGALMRIFKARPKLSKNTTTLTADFTFNGVEIKVYNYKTKKCVIMKKKIVHEAEAEKIIPAKAGWVEEVDELICEMPQVETEIASVAPTEVPF